MAWVGQAVLTSPNPGFSHTWHPKVILKNLIRCKAEPPWKRPISDRGLIASKMPNMGLQVSGGVGEGKLIPVKNGIDLNTGADGN